LAGEADLSSLFFSTRHAKQTFPITSLNLNRLTKNHPKRVLLFTVYFLPDPVSTAWLQSGGRAFGVWEKLAGG
jgi:hypothetical protein